MAKDEARRVTCRLEAVDATYDLAYDVGHAKTPV